ncbi:extracellular solute-binding protein [Aureimonas fodinaquatilis]|nr:extracellular solute-binding protein [Aureimonas fodinaquatilis]
MTGSINRRMVLAGGAATIGALAMPSIARGAPRTFVIGTNGGTAYEGFYRGVLQHFEQRYNAKVVPVFGSGTELLNRVLAERAQPTLDCVTTYIGDWDVGKAEGVFEKVNYDKIERVDEIYDFMHDKDGYAPFINFGVWGIVYDGSMVSAPPKSFKELWDEQYARQIMIGGLNHHQIHLAAFAHAWTGDQHNIDAAFDKLKELAPRLAGYYGLNSDTQSKFQQGWASIASWYSHHAHRVRNSGIPLEFAFPEEGAWIYPQAYHAIKGTENVDLVEGLISTFFDPEIASAYAQTDGYIPGNPNAVIEGELRQFIPTIDQVMESNSWDFDFINANEGEWLNRWNAEITPLIKS